MQEQELANARQVMDGKMIKKTRPRRTVDYNGGMGRWVLVSRTRLAYVRMHIIYNVDAETSPKLNLRATLETKSSFHYRRMISYFKAYTQYGHKYCIAVAAKGIPR